MHPDRYAHDVFQAIAAKQLMKQGIEVSGGQTVRYLITDAENKRPNSRVKVAELVNNDTRFDTEKYVDMAILAGANVLSPFGYAEEALKDQIVYGEKQTLLKPVLTTT
jgi:DNA polymerase elongation subunit (family B)